MAMFEISFLKLLASSERNKKAIRLRPYGSQKEKAMGLTGHPWLPSRHQEWIYG
jgi:hypothetical protein